MTIDGLFKKAIGKIHKPTAISALEDEVLETSVMIQYYEKIVNDLQIKKAKLNQKIGMMKDE